MLQHAGCRVSVTQPDRFSEQAHLLGATVASPFAATIRMILAQEHPVRDGGAEAIAVLDVRPVTADALMPDRSARALLVAEALEAVG